MKKNVLILFCLTCFTFAFGKIDRKALVERHNVRTTFTIPSSPAQVGNGEFAFNMDITGLQSFTPFNTLSNWAYHSSPTPQEYEGRKLKGVDIVTQNRSINYETPAADEREFVSFLAANPSRFNLGRVGFEFLKKDGSLADEGYLKNKSQSVNLWTGVITSVFFLDGEKIEVHTACYADKDLVGVKVSSKLLAQKRIRVFFEFPYADKRYMAEFVGDYSKPFAHKSTLSAFGNSAKISRTADSLKYFVNINWQGSAKIYAASEAENNHKFYLENLGEDVLDFTFEFCKSDRPNSNLNFDAVCKSSQQAWENFWNSGAAIDFSESLDPRWKELERRVVLSQYLMRINESGSKFPQESGLLANTWFGRAHFEMIWWHGVHYALWDRWALLEKSLSTYSDFLESAVQRAKNQGYKGARWPKCPTNEGVEWPHIIHATLIWQQPHPIYFAELDFRLHPTKETLEKWSDIVFATADFMASYAMFDEKKQKFILPPPMTLVSENTDQLKTQNPAFELGYWRYGLRKANEWRKRMGLEENAEWRNVLENLQPLPAQDGVYVLHEGVEDMWTKYNFEHPALIGVFGMLPGDGVDEKVFQKTLDKVLNKWRFDQIWGWDFPMLAMALARSGKPEEAVDVLLMPAERFSFDVHGFATGGPIKYFPSNGGLLAAVAMMAKGWTQAQGHAPGFPKNWKLNCENLKEFE